MSHDEEQNLQGHHCKLEAERPCDAIEFGTMM